MIYSYNKNQQDALFLNFSLVTNSSYFGQTYCPSSGVLILYSLQQVFFILKFEKFLKLLVYACMHVCMYVYTGVPGGMCQTSGECSLC